MPRALSLALGWLLAAYAVLRAARPRRRERLRIEIRGLDGLRRDAGVRMQNLERWAAR